MVMIDLQQKKDKLFHWIRENTFFAGVLAFLAVFFFLNVVVAILGINTEFSVKGKYPVRIAEGMSTREISEMLHGRRLVKYPKAFRFEARLKGLEKKMQAGLYSVDGGMSNAAIIDALFKGNVKFARLVVPEGYTIAKIAKVLEKEGYGSSKIFCNEAKDYAPYDYMKTNIPGTIYKAEGFIYPAVYEFPASYSEKDILALMVRTFHDEMQRCGIFNQVRKKNLSMRDVVNMASMVELEAVFEEEQPLIAGVFQKRIEIGMPIQSDTTIQYILGGDQKEIITWKDTEIKSPYNTYINYGLPPGPIASPGLSAIKAVLNPIKSSYLYFVAERDGHHRFSTNYIDHMKAISEIENGR